MPRASISPSSKKKVKSVSPNKISRSSSAVKSVKGAGKKIKTSEAEKKAKAKVPARPALKRTPSPSKIITPPPKAARHILEKGIPPEDNTSAASKTAGALAQKTSLIKQYEAAVRMVYRQEYEKAREVLEKIIHMPAHDKDVTERARSLLKVCLQKILADSASPRTAEEHYNYGVALMNQGQYDAAQENLQKALRADPKSDYVLYAMAANQSRAGNAAEALNFLKLAIQTNPANRFIARNDSDFESIAEDPRFISLIH